ncbi:DUF2203 domain-containing protein [bacterium]|nr:DUF2203 domain-containing protein [bacterium]
MPQYLHNRHFTVDEARSVLKSIRPKIEEMLQLRARLTELNYDIYKHAYFGGRGPNGSRYHPDELEALVCILRDLELKGVLIKSIEEGLIDFPHVRENGEEVYLCWKIGEENIDYWHSIADGFQGRRSIDHL